MAHAAWVTCNGHAVSLWGAKTRFRHAAASSSWMRPPSRSRPRTFRGDAASAWCCGAEAGARPSQVTPTSSLAKGRGRGFAGPLRERPAEGRRVSDGHPPESESDRDVALRSRGPARSPSRCTRISERPRSARVDANSPRDGALVTPGRLGRHDLPPAPRSLEGRSLRGSPARLEDVVSGTVRSHRQPLVSPVRCPS
jgi:hypothetical protein